MLVMCGELARYGILPVIFTVLTLVPGKAGDCILAVGK